MFHEFYRAEKVKLKKKMCRMRSRIVFPASFISFQKNKKSLYAAGYKH
ncbi:hypothetical protein CHCC14820_3583 [Bacillus paralicheniformis]|nr:hypothetical protein LI6934_13805 [Bacillus licheniformis LMG 6934]OLG13018.1 hypothetical protein B4123_0440 [Bacillus paralicheniformis]TWJ52234.1 hypothetical protein CHCC5023_4355 [Bacillus paralicheniformis]TWJ70802.1 hypothetical protein CHCC5019_3863 [Bacillus paralicheniformis]TWM37685.1 hypothetical protein CHCC14820_3583 [Bacillus paralicheniformis]